jgi:hypothetical protein
MTLGLAMRARLLAGAALAALAAATAMLAFGMGPFGGASSSQEQTLGEAPPRPPAKADPAPARAGRTTSAAKPAPPVDEAPVPVEPVEPANGLPVPITQALALHDVVVVSLVSPAAPVDGLALSEARAGAKLAGAGFVRIPVASQRDMKHLTAVLGVRHTPSLLVFARPSHLFVQVNGFADRETVAQAATNATS